jgi:flagellum-specific peptidoglycan hydrolase FlgJ
MHKFKAYIFLIVFGCVACHTTKTADRPIEENNSHFEIKPLTTEQYIDKYKNIAISEMKHYRVPASITLAQGILESGSGNSDLAREANNHFGIKCKPDWKGQTFTKDDDKKNDCFKSYKSVEESFNDHIAYLQGKRYASLFDLKIKDYKGWARGLKKCGYATNPQYPQLLIGIIEKYNLHSLDK